MPRSSPQLRADALAIWQAAVEAVKSDRLVQAQVRVDGDWLLIGEETQARSASGGSALSSGDALRIALGSIDRIAVVGAGKAGAGMAAGLEAALGPRVLAEKQVTGWINVPADCVAGDTSPKRKRGIDASTKFIHLHPARPAGINEPTAEGVFGAEKILDLVASLGPNDLCFCLLSGGGSALLPAPAAGISLAEKQAVTRLLSGGGANIEELNTVRKQLSRIKGGGLARACRAGRLITLIISDVLGDPLDVIASGPTVSDSHTAREALAILQHYAGGDESVAPAAFACLKNKGDILLFQQADRDKVECPLFLIGNNAVAVDAAGMEAERRGYSHAMHAATKLEGPAEDVGRHLARMALEMQSQPGPDCLITGGEPTVKLAPPERRGKGGRNQQLVLAALKEILDFGFPILDPQQGNPESRIQNPKFCLLSGGTDGEDGPTDAAGAWVDEEVIARMHAQALDPADFLRRNDAYSFFDAVGGLIKTGPTHTNVCDVRVVVVDRP